MAPHLTSRRCRREPPPPAWPDADARRSPLPTEVMDLKVEGRSSCTYRWGPSRSRSGSPASQPVRLKLKQQLSPAKRRSGPWRRRRRVEARSSSSSPRRSSAAALLPSPAAPWYVIDPAGSAFLAFLVREGRHQHPRVPRVSMFSYVRARGVTPPRPQRVDDDDARLLYPPPERLVVQVVVRRSRRRSSKRAPPPGLGGRREYARHKTPPRSPRTTTCQTRLRCARSTPRGSNTDSSPPTVPILPLHRSPCSADTRMGLLASNGSNHVRAFSHTRSPLIWRGSRPPPKRAGARCAFRETSPVVAPTVRLRRVPARVVHREAEPARARLGVQRLRQVRRRERRAGRRWRRAQSKVHDDRRSSRRGTPRARRLRSAPPGSRVCPPRAARRPAASPANISGSRADVFTKAASRWTSRRRRTRGPPRPHPRLPR